MLRKWAAHPKVVAIGETGLDYHRLPAPEEVEGYKARQAEIFEQQLEIAAELKMNCIIHQRDSFEDTLRQLAPWAGKVRGVFHCFGGDVTAMQRVIEMGSLVSFTGIVTFKNARDLQDVAKTIPQERLLVETDSPFLAPVPHRGKTCEPAFVADTAAFVAELRGEELEALADATTTNFFRLFSKAAA